MSTSELLDVLINEVSQILMTWPTNLTMLTLFQVNECKEKSEKEAAASHVVDLVLQWVKGAWMDFDNNKENLDKTHSLFMACGQLFPILCGVFSFLFEPSTIGYY